MGAPELHESDSYDRADQQQGNERFGVTRDIHIEIHWCVRPFVRVRRATPGESLVAAVTKPWQNDGGERYFVGLGSVVDAT